MRVATFTTAEAGNLHPRTTRIGSPWPNGSVGKQQAVLPTSSRRHVGRRATRRAVFAQPSEGSAPRRKVKSYLLVHVRCSPRHQSFRIIRSPQTKMLEGFRLKLIKQPPEELLLAHAFSTTYGSPVPCLFDPRIPAGWLLLTKVSIGDRVKLNLTCPFSYKGVPEAGRQGDGALPPF